MKKIAIVFLTALTFFPSFTNGQTERKDLTLDLVWASSTFSPEYVYAVRSMNDGEHFSSLENNSIKKYSYTNFGESKEVIYSGSTNSLEISDYSFNADESKLLVATNQKSIYRRSSEANYYIVDLKAKTAVQLYNKGPQMLADFSPDGTKVAFVYENNIYIKNIADEKVKQITFDGKKNAIINGSSDWVYEEEFEVTKAFYWSPAGTKIAYLKFDESKVHEFTMDYYNRGTYPEQYIFKYPKAGEDNSKLSLHIYTLALDKSSEVVIGDYEYVPRMKWTKDDNKLVFLVMNRHQNDLSYVMSTVDKNGVANGDIFYADRSDTYVEVDNNLIFLEDEDAMIRTSEKDGYNHIYKVGFDGKETQITKGNWDVVNIEGFNEKKGIVYYISAEQGPMYKALYSIGLKGDKKTLLSKSKGTNSASFSTGMKYYMNYYSNANEPYTISVHDSKGTQMSVLKDNSALKARLKEYKIAPKEFIQIQGSTEMLNAFIIKPLDFDPSKKYPIYFNVYNGPGSNMVEDSWGGSNFLYHQLLAQKGYIVISVDTRGTMYRGTKFKKSTYLQLGKLETEDMLVVGKNVSKWDFVASDRIGVMGWSYGGYMAALCMTKGAGVYKMGISVAPVTNWRWYDNIYTERFMRTPQENPHGYDDNSPINHIDTFTGKYLLIHGSGDDNVHVQNTMEMANALVNKNKDFDMFIYPNRNHGIYGGKTRLHLFTKMLDFTLENL